MGVGNGRSIALVAGTFGMGEYGRFHSFTAGRSQSAKRPEEDSCASVGKKEKSLA